jgi:hypothetical protein
MTDMRAMYLPQERAKDRERRKKAGVTSSNCAGVWNVIMKN